MSFVVTSLADYTKENSQELIVKSILKAKTASMMTVQTGIKTSEKIKLFETDATFQAGGTCGFNASGTTTLTDRPITVGKIKVQEALCPEDLEAKSTQLMLAAGSKYDSIPFEQAWTDRKIEVIAKQMETAIWQGDTASVTANLQRFDGALKIIDAATPVTGNSTGITAITGLTDSNIITAVDKHIEAIPMEVYDADDIVTFIDPAEFRRLVRKLKDLNHFHFMPTDSSMELVYPGTNMKLIAVNGLAGTDRFITTRLSNFYLGTDLENEYEQFKVWYSEDDELVKFSSKWKAGVQFAFPDQVVSFKLV